MATNDNGGWEDAPQGALPLQTAMAVSDADIQSRYPKWPSGGTAAQLGIESKYNPNAVGPKGATGMAQVMPATLRAIEQQTGRKLDPHNVNDSLFIHRYLMEQNLQRTNGDVNGALSLYNSGRATPDNTETKNYVSNFAAKTNSNNVDSPSSSNGWEDAPTQQPTQEAQSGSWEDAPKSPSNWDSLKGLGMQAANFAGGALEALPIGISTALHGVENLANGQGLSEALGNAVQSGQQEFSQFSPENLLNKAGVDTSALHETQGYQLPQKALDFAFNTVPNKLAPYLAQGIANQTGYDKAINAQDVKDITNLEQGLLLTAPVAGSLAHVTGKAGGAGEAELAAQKLQDMRGPADEPTSSFEEMMNRADQQNGAFGPGKPVEEAPVEEQVPIQQGRNLRQMELDFENGNDRVGPNEPIAVNQEGEAAPMSEMEAIRPFKDEMERRVQEFNNEPVQGDLFNDLDQRRYDQYGPDEEPRTLSREEFDQTMDNLASRPETAFEVPEDRDQAYDKYLDTVSDRQGGLFDRPTIAKNFAKAVNDSILERKVNEQLTVKANQGRVDALQAQIASMQPGKSRRTLEGRLEDAQKTLEKSKENITKFFQGSMDSVAAKVHPFDKDGVIEMNMGLKPPQWLMDGIGRMLKAFHGIVFKQLSRMISKPSTIDSTAKIIKSGIADAINKQANKNWEVQKNGNAVDRIQGGNSPLGKFDAIKEWIPDDRPYEEVKQDFQQAPDMDSNMLTKNVAQGGLWASTISKSPVVKWAYTKISGAQKMIDYQVKQLLTDKSNGLQAKMRALNDSEKGEIYALMDLNEGEKRFTEGELRAKGFNEKQIDYYKTHFDVMDKILGQVNDARNKIGLPAIDPRIAYMSSRFVGDFRSLVYQKGTGRIVGFVGHDNRWMLNQIIKHIDEQNPGKYDFEKPTLNRPDNQHPQNMFQGYMNALDLLSKTDSDVKGILDSYRSYLTNDAAKMLGALKHAKDKEGIFGAEGKKAWENQKTNAVNGMQSQLKYAENMIKWSNLQDAAHEVKQMLVDPDVDKPNAKSYVNDYLNNAIGHTASPLRDAMNGILNGIANATGMGPSYFRGLNNFQKSALLQMWLGFFRIPHSMLTLTQFFQSNPQFARMVKARGIDDVHFWSSTLKGTNTSLNLMKAFVRNGDTSHLNPTEKAIWNYNKTNAVFAVNLKNHLEDISRSPIKRIIDNTVEANVIYPELALRAVTFSTWTHALVDAGMEMKDALGTAENFTRGAMVDYRPIERPLVYGKMGFMGDIASTLTRFKMNQLSQHIYFGKNAIKEGQITPLMVMLGTSIAFAGASGMLGFNWANELYRQFSTHIVGKPDSLKGVFLRNLPDWANYGMFSQLGINMQGSYSNADIIPDNPWATLFPTGSTLAGMAGSMIDLARNRDKATLKQVLYNYSPTSLKGVEENYMFSKDAGNGNKEFHRPGSDELQSIRTNNPNNPFDLTTDTGKRNFAFHPFTEARNYDVAAEAKNTANDYAYLRERDLKKFTDILQNRQPTQDELHQLQQDWVSHRGTGQDLANAITKWQTERHETQMQRARGVNPNTLSDMYRVLDINAMKGEKK